MVTNNLLVPAAILMLTPSKLIHNFYSANSFLGLQYLVKNYNLLTGMKETRKYLESLLCKFIVEYNLYCITIIGENISCKVRKESSLIGGKFMNSYF